MHNLFNALAHILLMTAFAASIFMAFAIARDVQQDRRASTAWEKCPMCSGCGKVPPLPEVIP